MPTVPGVRSASRGRQRGSPLRVVSAALLAGAIALSGCVRFEATLVLKPDGSGTLDLGYSLAEDVIGQISTMRKLGDELATAAGRPAGRRAETDFTRLLFDPSQSEIQDKLKGYEPFGVRAEKAEVKSKQGRRQVQIRIRFESLAELARTDFFQEYGFSLTRLTNGNYRIHRASHLRAKAPADGEPEVSRDLMPLLQGLDVSLTARMPGRALSATTRDRGVYSATWRFEYDRDPNALTALQSQDFELVFEGEDARLPNIPWRPEPTPRAPATNAPPPAPAAR